MNYLKSFFYGILLLFILLVTLLGFLLTTTPGMYAVIKLANLTTPGTIHIKKPGGRLLDDARFATVTYEDDAVRIVLSNTHLNWSLRTLWNNQLTIHALHADTLLVHVKDTPKTIEKVADTEFSFPQLPFDLKLDDLIINSFKIEQAAAVKQVDNLVFQALLTNTQWDISKLAMDIDTMHVTLAANGEPIKPYALKASLDFSPVIPQSHGLSGTINIEGNYAQYQWTGHFKGPVKGTIQGRLRNGVQVETHVSWQDAIWPINAQNNTFKSQEGSIIISGLLNDLLIEVDAKINTPVNAKLQINTTVKQYQVKSTATLSLPHGLINGHFFYNDQSSPKFNGKITTKNLDLADFNLPISGLEFTTVFKGSSAQTVSSQTNVSATYLDHALKGYINYDLNTLKATLSLGMNTISIKGVPPYSLNATATIPEPYYLHPSLAGLHTKMALKAHLSDPQHGALSLTVNPGNFHSITDQSLPVIKFEGGTLDANLTPKALKAKGRFIIDQHKTVHMSLTMPQFTMTNPSNPEQQINGTLGISIQSLAFLEGLTQALEKLQGQLHIGLNATGTIKKPVVVGDLTLKNASVFIPGLNVTLNPIQFKIDTQKNKWKASGSIASNSQTLTINGEGGTTPKLIGVLNIQGANFQAVKTAEYTIAISPDIKVGFKPDEIDIDGTILIPSATLKPISFSNTVNLSEDAVFASKKKAPLPITISTNLLLKMGQDVAIDIQGLHGFLDGQLQLKQKPQGEMYGVGELTVRDGKYKAYGQDLAIEQGQLLFTGVQVSNPGIRLKAVRYFKNASSSFSGSNELFDFNPKNLQSMNFGSKTSAGIQVSGRVNSPKITLFSVPGNLSQADILSMIILGRPANQASKSGGQLLLTAISSMNLDSGTNGVSLMEQLKQKLGFDIDVQSGSEYNQQTRQVNDSTSFVVGKALSERIYLSYNIGLFTQDSNVLTLKYLLNKFFSIQVSASDTGSGIDVLYTHRKD